MVEETIQTIIISALAIAPVLFLFLRRWMSRHGGFRRKKDTLPPLPPRQREPRPIYERLRPDKAQDTAEARARRSGLAEWASFQPNGALIEDQPEEDTDKPEAGDLAAWSDSKAVIEPREQPPAAVWDRVENLSRLKRAIAYSEVLGSPRGLHPWGDSANRIGPPR